MSTYFLLDPFEFSYYFYRIRAESIYVLSIVACIPSTFYGQYTNQFPPNTIKVIREFERIQKKICRHKMSIMFNEICINEEMLPKYTYIHVYIYIYVGYHLPFQHNELCHLPYMAVAEISLGISLSVRPEEPFLLLKYIITLSLILCSYY